MSTGLKRDWRWLPTQMPVVTRLMREKRAELGDEWVNTCWRRGVVEMQPGWFYAAEGALAVGTPWQEDLDVAALWAARLSPTQVLLLLRPKDAPAGA